MNENLKYIDQLGTMFHIHEWSCPLTTVEHFTSTDQFKLYVCTIVSTLSETAQNLPQICLPRQYLPCCIWELKIYLKLTQLETGKMPQVSCMLVLSSQKHTSGHGLLLFIRTPEPGASGAKLLILKGLWVITMRSRAGPSLPDQQKISRRNYSRYRTSTTTCSGFLCARLQPWHQHFSLTGISEGKKRFPLYFFFIASLASICGLYI